MGRSRLVALLVVFLLAVGALWTVIAVRGLEPQLGLDLQGGVSITLIPSQGQGDIDDSVLDQTVEVIRQRVDGLGVAEPDIARQGDTVLVQLPGVTERRQAVDIIGRTAKLEFRPVLAVLQPGTPEYRQAGQPCDEVRTQPVPADEPAVLCEKLRGEPPEPGAPEPVLPADQWAKLRVGPAELEGTDVADAQAAPDQATGLNWEVNLDLTSAGARTFEQLTGELACNPQGDPRRQLAIVLDNVVESAPPMAAEIQCNQGIAGGQAVITVGGAEQEAHELELVLRTGALPITLEPATVQSVSPTLGRSALQGALLAGVLGLVLVAAYLIVLYRGMGLAAIAELAMFGVLTYGLIIVMGNTIGFTLTLAGIAGVIVSIGIAADSSIIYRERYRDETRAGRTVRTAADHAFSASLRTNLTGNVVSVLAAVVLYLLAVGPVRGFAFTLGLSTIIDTLLFVTFTRALFGLVARSPRLARSRWMGLRAEIVGPPATVPAEATPVGGRGARR